MDTDVNNYSIPDLFAILDLTEDNATPELVEQKTGAYITRFSREGNEDMRLFFEDIQERLLDFLEEENEKTTQNWINNEYLQQPNDTQREKITNRKNEIGIYEENEHNVMNRNQLGVNNSFNVPVAQDSLNPTLKNISERFINLDSQFRQSDDPATDYSLDLSDHLKDVLSLRLYSFQIPVTWYNVDVAYHTTCFWICDKVSGINVLVNIDPGNYSAADLTSAISAKLAAIGFTSLPSPSVSYNNQTGKITINLYGARYTNPINSAEIFIVTEATNITFFDFTSQLTCETSCVNQGSFINQSLGWIMGFRSNIETVTPNGITGQAIVDLIGPRYLILVIDDYNQNHLHNGLVSITEISKTLKMPSYYSQDMPYTCVLGAATTIANEKAFYGNKIVGSTSYPQVLPSAPRTLTQTQIYTINEIIKTSDQTYNSRPQAPTTTDVLALIPIKGGQSLGSLYTEISGSLQTFKRSYFGPVNIDRFRVKLLDDKGNILNLNGCDWSVTLICECLYQY
jgi:hypothetical protein